MHDKVEKSLETILSKAKKASYKSHGDILYFDIETVPNWHALERLGIERVEVQECSPMKDMPPTDWCKEASVAEIKEMLSRCNPPQEWLDAAEKEELEGKARKGVFDLFRQSALATASQSEAIENQIKKLSTSPQLCQIIALGVAIDEGDIMTTAEEPEAVIIDEFWKFAKMANRICGFNILGFDIPVIQWRSAMLKREPSRQFDTKPWGSDCIDLYLKIKGGRRESPGKLKELARLAGFDVPLVDGSDVFNLYTSGDWDTIHDYVGADVDLVRALHQRLRAYL